MAAWTRQLKNPARATVAALCLCCSFVLTGCSHGYALTLSNSDVIYARTKPRLNDRGYYVFKDGQGQEQQVKAMRVRMIEAR